MSSSEVLLSDTDASVLYRYGQVITEDVVRLLAETALVTLYGVIFVFAMYSFYRRGIKSRISLVMLFLVIYLYLSSMVLWALDIAPFFMFVHDVLMTGNIPLVLADAHIDSFDVPGMVIFTSNMILGDFIVIWRVWVIYYHARKIVVLPCITLAAALVFALIDTFCVSPDAGIVSGGVYGKSALISWAFSLATNVLCTIFIGFKAWKHKRIAQELHIEVMVHKRCGTDFILSLLVESGLIYCLLWATQIVQIFKPSRTSALYYVWELANVASEQIPGIYPTLIMVVVNLRYTIDWEDGSSSSTGAVHGRRNPDRSTLRWAHSSIQSTYLQPTDSERGDPTFDVPIVDTGVPLKILAASTSETGGDLKS